MTFMVGFILAMVAMGFLASVGPNQMIRTDVLDEYCELKEGITSYYIDDIPFGVDPDINCYIEEEQKECCFNGETLICPTGYTKVVSMIIEGTNIKLDYSEINKCNSFDSDALGEKDDE